MKKDLNYLITQSETKTENFTLISTSNLPFYKEILCYFNGCKKTIDASNISDIKYAEKPLRNNNGKTVCFQNQIASNNLYVEEAYVENSLFKSLQEF